MRHFHGAAFWLFFVVTTSVVVAHYPTSLMYLPRGDRTEGLMAEPKSADAIVLVSALADASGREPFAEWPQELHLRFYFPPGEKPPFVRVRQLRSLTGYYVMDNVTPGTPWVAGAVNDYAWKRDVVANIYDYQVAPNRRSQMTKSDWLADLGALVSLGPTGATHSLQHITVAPATLDHSTRPFAVSSYLFTFRTNASGHVTGAILSAANREVLSGLHYQATAGSPFTIKWPVKDQPDGWYRLMLDASLAGQPQVVVRFYHKANQ